MKNSIRKVKTISDSSVTASFLITLKEFDVDNLKQLARLANYLNVNKIISCPRQIHSSVFFLYPDQQIEQGDGIITRNFDLAIGVRVADCPAVALFDQREEIMGIFHCGWRGLKNQILIKAGDKFKSMGSRVDDIQAVIYPHICQSCYEVGEELTNYFNQGSIKCINNKYFLSLQQEINSQLFNLGINRIYNTDSCTCHQPDLFHSYRRYRHQGVNNHRRMYALAIQSR